MGSIQTGSYEALDGTRRYTTDVLVKEFRFLESNKNNNTDPYNGFYEVDDSQIPF